MSHNWIKDYDTPRNKVYYCDICELIKQDFINHKDIRVIEYYVGYNPEIVFVEPSCNEVIMENVLK